MWSQNWKVVLSIGWQQISFIKVFVQIRLRHAEPKDHNGVSIDQHIFQTRRPKGVNTKQTLVIWDSIQLLSCPRTLRVSHLLIMSSKTVLNSWLIIFQGTLALFHQQEHIQMLISNQKLRKKEWHTLKPIY